MQRAATIIFIAVLGVLTVMILTVAGRRIRRTQPRRLAARLRLGWRPAAVVDRFSA
jgi:hypothetical protein